MEDERAISPLSDFRDMKEDLTPSNYEIVTKTPALDLDAEAYKYQRQEVSETSVDPNAESYEYQRQVSDCSVGPPLVSPFTVSTASGRTFSSVSTMSEYSKEDGRDVRREPSLLEFCHDLVNETIDTKPSDSMKLESGLSPPHSSRTTKYDSSPRRYCKLCPQCPLFVTQALLCAHISIAHRAIKQMSVCKHNWKVNDFKEPKFTAKHTGNLQPCATCGFTGRGYSHRFSPLLASAKCGHSLCRNCFLVSFKHNSYYNCEFDGCGIRSCSFDYRQEDAGCTCSKLSIYWDLDSRTQPIRMRKDVNRHLFLTNSSQNTLLMKSQAQNHIGTNNEEMQAVSNHKPSTSDMFDLTPQGKKDRISPTILLNSTSIEISNDESINKWRNVASEGFGEQHANRSVASSPHPRRPRYTDYETNVLSDDCNSITTDESMGEETDFEDPDWVAVVRAAKDRSNSKADLTWRGIFRTCATGNGRSTGNGQTRSNPEQRSQGGSIKRRKIQEDESSDRDENDEEEDQGAGNNHQSQPAFHYDKRFACPFFKNNPQKYNPMNKLRYRACFGPGWKSFKDVKDHIFRRHRAPIHCDRCFEEFPRESKRREHHQQEISCIRRSPRPIEGITVEQREEIKKEQRKCPTEMEKWNKVYEMLFPSAEAIPDPYHATENDTNDPEPTPMSFLASQCRARLRTVISQSIAEVVETSPQLTLGSVIVNDELVVKIYEVLTRRIDTLLNTVCVEWEASAREAPSRSQHDIAPSMPNETFDQGMGRHYNNGGVLPTHAMATNLHGAAGNNSEANEFHDDLNNMVPRPPFSNEINQENSGDANSLESDLNASQNATPAEGESSSSETAWQTNEENVPRTFNDMGNAVNDNLIDPDLEALVANLNSPGELFWKGS